jgi:hypothetical protein
MEHTPREIMRALMEAVANARPAEAPRMSAKVAMNKFMQTLPNYYHELGSDSIASTHLYRGRGNRDLDTIVQYLQSNGYRRVINRNEEQEWEKVTGKPYGDTSLMRSYHTVRIITRNGSVINVQHSSSQSGPR